MDAEELSYKTLRKIQQSERQSPTLTHIHPEFYPELSRYLSRLHNRLEKENTPQKQMLLHEELQNIEKIARNIYEHREKKLILAAVSKARGGSPSLKNMVREEKTFFQNLLNLIFDARSSILDQNPGEQTNEVKKEIPKEPNDFKEHRTPEQQQETAPVQQEKELREPNTHPLIRVLKEMPSFVGTDTKTYHLNKGDILSIPEDMAEMLVKRKVAQKLNQG